MSTEDELHRHAKRGGDAQRLLNDPLLKETLDAIKTEVVRQWAETPARDEEAREWLWRHYKVAERITAMLQGFADTGRVAIHDLEEKGRFRKAADKFSRWAA